MKRIKENIMERNQGDIPERHKRNGMERTVVHCKEDGKERKNSKEDRTERKKSRKKGEKLVKEKEWRERK